MIAHSNWRIVSVAALALFGAVAATDAAEVKYPTKPIRIIVPYPPGGSTDPTARVFGAWLSEKFGDVIRTELARWTKVIRDAGIQAN